LGVIELPEYSKYRLVSLFAGCGGLDLGFKGEFAYLQQRFKSQPFEHVLANEINPAAAKTFRENFPDVLVNTEDVRSLASKITFSQPIDVVTGGFPCQDFSLAGKRQGLNVSRGQLYLSMVEVVERLQPKIFLAENVKGLMTWEKGLALEVIATDFAALGYKVEYRLLNAADYGVPQIRKRVIIIGVRSDLQKRFNWPEATHSENGENGSPKWRTSQDAISDLEVRDESAMLPNSGFSKAKITLGRQGNKPIAADLPSVTIRAEHHGNIEFHYDASRRLSAREAARLQSFPDDFEFFNSTTDAYRQIGNAVAPVFAWHLANSVASFLDSVFPDSKALIPKN
jgi:DNA (cytosine-5)-methyltransferase 1